MTVKITGLSPLNVRAIRETMSDVELTGTTATFPGTAQESFERVTGIINSLPGRAHPKASLHAVARKLYSRIQTLKLQDQ